MIALNLDPHCQEDILARSPEQNKHLQMPGPRIVLGNG